MASAEIQYQLEHYNDDRGPELLAGTVICIVSAILAVALRIYAQSLVGRTWSLDTFLIFIALIFVLALDVATIAAISYGLGKHQVRVLREDPHPPSNTLRIFQIGWVMSWMNCLALMFTKLAILYFYSKVFTMLQRPFKLALYIIGTYSVLLGVGSTIEFIVGCLPIDYFWKVPAYTANFLEPPFPVNGWCMPQELHLAIPLIADLVSDVCILILPTLVLRRLQMPLRKKVALFFTFSMGIFVCAVGVVRIYYTVPVDNGGGDVGWNNANSAIWTDVQISMGIICACVPASAPLLRFLPTRGHSHGNSSKHKGSSISTSWGRFTHWKPYSHYRKPSDNDSMRNLAPTVPHNEPIKEHDLEELGSNNQCYVMGSPADIQESQGIPMDSIQVLKNVDVTRG